MFYVFSIVCIVTPPNVTTILAAQICDHVIDLPSSTYQVRPKRAPANCSVESSNSAILYALR